MKAKILDLREICKGKRVITIGDPHGCFNEVMQLLKAFEWKMAQDILVFSDRGPDIYKLVNFVRYIDNVYCAEGNHENRIKRWLRGSPVHIGVQHWRTIDCFKFELESPRRKQELTDWFESLPQMIQIADSAYVVHAGIKPYISIENQEADDCLWIRSADAAGNMKWWDWHRGPDAPTILFGHSVTLTAHIAPGVLSLDGGCVYGGELRGASMMDGQLLEVKSVPAGKVYYDHNRIAVEEGYSSERRKKGEPA